MSSGESWTRLPHFGRAVPRPSAADLDAAAEALGLSLPEDYRAFVSAHGACLVADRIHVYAPTPGVEDGPDLVGRQEAWAWVGEELGDELPIPAERLVFLAETAEGEGLAWVRGDDGRPERIVRFPDEAPPRLLDVSSSFTGLLDRLALGPDADGVPGARTVQAAERERLRGPAWDPETDTPPIDPAWWASNSDPERALVAAAAVGVPFAALVSAAASTLAVHGAEVAALRAQDRSFAAALETLGVPSALPVVELEVDDEPRDVDDGLRAVVAQLAQAASVEAEQGLGAGLELLARALRALSWLGALRADHTEARRTAVAGVLRRAIDLSQARRR
jgi:hypothetical protein